MKSELTKEHEWLSKLVGEWTWETTAEMDPAKGPETFRGTESVRSLGGTWLVLEGTGDEPGGKAHTNIMTLGYDPNRGKFVGTFVSSAMPYLWTYEGSLDESGTKLVLDCEGPSFENVGQMAQYKDTVEIIGGDRRALSSTFLAGDGTWKPVMRMDYRRA